MPDRQSDEERYAKEAFRRQNDDFTPSDDKQVRQGVFRQFKERVNEAAESFWPGHDVENHPVNDFRPFFNFLAKLAIYAVICAAIAGVLFRLLIALG